MTIGIGSGAGRAGGGKKVDSAMVTTAEPSDTVGERLTDGGVQGGLVTETGIALVEQGEMIRPTPGSRAMVELAHAETVTDVHIHLPVVVEIVGRSDDRELERLADETLRRLRLAIEAQPVREG